MMHGRETSGPAIVAGKSANAAGQPDGEPMEPRAGAKGNPGQAGTHRTPRRASVSPGLDRVRPAARDRPNLALRALCRHHPRWEPGAGMPHAGFCAGGMW
jgi:RNA-directed DNA polymerase